MRVLVTRPLPAATRTAERLRAAGHVPIVAPLTTIEPTGEPPPAGRFDAILVTSANAIPALARRPPAAKTRPVFALGTRTAGLVRLAGFPDVREGGADARALAGFVQRALPPSSVLLHVAGRDRKAEPASSLAAAGYTVTPWAAYAAVAASCLPAGLKTALSRGEIDAVLHYSRRSAAILRQLSERAGVLGGLERAVQLCLSGDVADALPGASRVVVAPAPTEDGMLHALQTLEPRPESAT